MVKKSQKYFIILITLCSFQTIKTNVKTDVRNNIKELEERSRRLYGDTQKRYVKLWELDVEDVSLYPNGDKTKLAEISHRWIHYYRCTSLAVTSITSSGHLSNTNVVVYEGEVARLSCALCLAPGESDRVTWFYAESIHNVTFKPLKDKTSMICNVNITIYNVQLRHAGVYRCQLGNSVSGLIVLEILDDHKYRVMNVKSNAIVQTISTSKLITFIMWSPWSDCSRCDRPGTRRRYGMCYVRRNNNKRSGTTSTSDSIFNEFPDGIGCNSRLLLDVHHNDSIIINRRNIIMTESCKSPCNHVFEVWSKTGELLERANNSDGVYSLSQSPPPQPPLPVREVIFMEHGEKLTLKCPGTTLRDIPITWRRGTKYLCAGSLAEETAGRVRLNTRDQIIFVSVDDGDANVYSCWQSTALAGVIKLEVWRDARLANRRPLAFVCLMLLGVAIHYTVKQLHSKMCHGQ